MPSEAPSCLARSSFSSLLEVMSTRAPASRANCSANSDTPPVPSVSTVSPAFNPASMRAFQAVTAAQGSVAASSKERWSGTATRPSS